MKKKESNLPETIKSDNDKGMVVLCESIQPGTIKKEDIDAFSVTLGPNNEITNNDATDNMINANVLNTISISDTMLKGTITNQAISEVNAYNLIDYTSYIQEECLQGIFINLVDQAFNNLRVEVRKTIDGYTDDGCANYSKIFAFMQPNNYTLRIVSKLFTAYGNSTTVEEFNVVAVQIATLFSNQLTINTRNDIYNIICKHVCGHSDTINRIMASLENDIILFHDTVVNIIFHITYLMINYYSNVRSYHNFTKYNLDF